MISASVEPHYHQEFQFADNTDSTGCCCFWRSKSNEYHINEKNTFVPIRGQAYKERIVANERLASIIKGKFQNDPIENNEAFERLKLKINDPMKNGDPITSERLAKIVIAIHEVKKEAQQEHSSSSKTSLTTKI